MLAQPPENIFPQARSFDPTQLLQGQTLTGFISDQRRHDFYALSVNQTSRFSAKLADIAADVDLRLLDSQGKILQGSYRSGLAADSIEQELAPGNYYIQVSEFYGSTKYHLTVSLRDLASNLSPMVGVKPASNQREIDALLNQNLTYWDTQASNGVITYSFYNKAAGSYYGSEKVTEVNEAIKANVRQILDRLETFINVQFVEVPDHATSYGALRYMFSDGEGNTGFYAYSYYPGAGIGGDVHLNPRWESGSEGRFSEDVGSYGYTTLMHETLHALGLKHPGNYDHGGGDSGGLFLPPEQDHKSNTIMSYNRIGAGASTPLSYDVRALQYLYGSAVTAERDSTYQFTTVTNTLSPVNQTIWDAGGIDTIDLSPMTNRFQTNYVDLRPGGIITTQLAYQSGRYIDLVTNQTFTAPEYGTMIAFGTTIENIVMSLGNDYVIANSANNWFSGYDRTAGNDVIENANGDDVLDLGRNRRSELGMTIEKRDLLVGLGKQGTVRLRNYFTNDNPIKILVDGVKYVYTTSGEWLAS
jgi:hypothetical protein